jgi:chemotaxis family two-component system sensor kinase Cph1
VEALYTRSQQGLRLAETLQRSLLPASLPVVPGWGITARYQTAEGGQVGGDWYDAFVSDTDTLTVVLGDVAGHGIAAAGIMAQLRNALRAYLFRSASPADALDKLNDFTAELLPTAFATVVVASIHLPTGKVRAASAGHLAPFLTTSGDRATPAPVQISPPIGVPSPNRTVSDFTVAPGTELILFSDGLVERRTEDLELGLNRLATALGRLDPHPHAAEIFAAVAEPGLYDDATVLAVHRAR